MTQDSTEGDIRLVEPNGDEIERLRRIQGLSVRDLAARAPVALKTLKSARLSTPIFYSRLKKIAKALGVAPVKIIKHPPDISPPKESTHVPLILTLVVVNRDDYDRYKESGFDTQFWIDMIQKGIIQHGVMNFNSTPGSIVLRALLAKSDCLRLSRAFMTGRLQKYEVSAIMLAANDATLPLVPSSLTTFLSSSKHEASPTVRASSVAGTRSKSYPMFSEETDLRALSYDY